MICSKRFLVAMAGSAVAAMLCVTSTALSRDLSDQQKLIEKLQIDDLLARSGWAADSNNVDAWIATFTPDGEWDTQYVTCKGPEALRTYFTKGFNCVGVPGGAAVPGAPARSGGMGRGGPGAMPAGAGSAPPGEANAPPPTTAGAPPAGAAGGRQGGGGGGFHMVSGAIYEFLDDHTVHYRARWMTVGGGDEAVGGRIVSVGYYDDTLVKLNGKWLIKQRQIKH